MQEFIDENETADEDLYEHHRFEIAKGQQPLRIDKFLINSIENTTKEKPKSIKKIIIAPTDRPIQLDDLNPNVDDDFEL